MSTQFINRQWRLPNNENKDKQSNYSMDFDIANYIDITATDTFDFNTNDFSVSFWMKKDGATGSFQPLVDFGGYAQSPYINQGTAIYSKNGHELHIYNRGGGNWVTTIKTQSSGWNHVCIVRSGDNLTAYINNSTEQVNQNFTGVSSENFGGILTSRIGGTNFWSGKIDGLAIFNYALSSSQITTLYGSSSTGIGNPMSLSPKPVAMYNLGDKSAFNGANYLVPNIAAEEADGDIVTSYSPYALNFDGTNYIGLSSGISTNSSSLSIWFKTTTTYAYKGLFGLNSPFSFDYYISLLETGSNKIKFYDGSTMISLTPVINDGNWHNLVLTYNHSSSSFKAYTDGSETYSGSYSQPSGMVLQYIGSTYAVNRKWVGDLSNASLWNAALTSAQVTEIYNEGVPSNLNNHSAYSNLVGWWQLGSNSSFNTNWTVLDEKGSINGISVNMTEDDIVDGVGSYANGLSSGMGGDEVIGDAPYSTANALSVNMDVADRVEDTPS